MPGTYNITIKRNDTLSKVFTFLDDQPTPQPINLSLGVITMEVRKKYDQPVLFTLTEGDGITVSGPDFNVVTLSKVVNIATPGTYKYDLQIVFSSGVVTTYLEGNFIVEPDITKI